MRSPNTSLYFRASNRTPVPLDVFNNGVANQSATSLASFSDLSVTIRQLQPHDIVEWLRMREALWPQEDAADIVNGLADYLAPTQPCAVFVSEAEPGRLSGFIEVAIRSYAEGCRTDCVGYIEGWWVDEEYRQTGIGSALMHAAEAWARQQGCNEMGSDAVVENAISQQAHQQLGYQVSETLVHFRKPLTSKGDRTPLDIR